MDKKPLPYLPEIRFSFALNLTPTQKDAATFAKPEIKCFRGACAGGYVKYVLVMFYQTTGKST